MQAGKRARTTISGSPPVAIATLSERERQIVARHHPELGGYESAVVIVAEAAVCEEVASAIELLRQAVNEQMSVQFEALIAECLAEQPPTVTRQEAMRQARFRQRVIAEQGGYTAPELADMNGSHAANRYRMASGWRSARRVFGVEYQDRTIYLAFQFDQCGRPLPVIESILHSFTAWADWEIAAWFVRPNGLLHNEQPVELLHTAPERVVTAAAVDSRQGLSPLRQTQHARVQARARRDRNIPSATNHTDEHADR